VSELISVPNRHRADGVSHKTGGRMSLLCARFTIISPAAEYDCFLADTNC